MNTKTTLTPQFSRVRPSLALSSFSTSASPIATFYRSTGGMRFEINPEFLPSIQALIAQVRNEIQAARASDRFVCYLSVPVSPRGGGHFTINNEIAAATRTELISSFGPRLMIIDPASYNLRDIAGVRAGGGEYMAVWSDVLSGLDGRGTEIDMVYFAGPRDVARFFGTNGPDKIGQLENWMTQRANSDPLFQQHISDNVRRFNFIRYYALRGSSAYSKGAHDEWNIVVSINSKRGVGEEVAVYFNGEPIEPGDYDDGAAVGYQVVLGS